jgi:hypothetical protein
MSDNQPGFVDIAIHCYRHRFGSIPGNPALVSIEGRLAHQPDIGVPTVVLAGCGRWR